MSTTALAAAGQRPSTPTTLFQLTPANLALMEQRHATTSFDTIQEYLARQSHTVYSPRAPSLSPMVHSQDRILALQQLEVGRNAQDALPEHAPVCGEEPALQQLTQPRSPGVAISMKTKDGRKPRHRRSTHDEVAQRLEHRKQRRRQKKLIVQDRSRPLSARLRSQQQSKNKKRGMSKYTTSKAQRVLALAGHAYKPLTRMTKDRLTVRSQVGMFSGATASVPVALLESSLADRTASTRKLRRLSSSSSRDSRDSRDSSDHSDDNNEERMDSPKHSQTPSAHTAQTSLHHLRGYSQSPSAHTAHTSPHHLDQRTTPDLSEAKQSQPTHSIWQAQIQMQVRAQPFREHTPPESRKLLQQSLSHSEYQSLSPTWAPDPSEALRSSRHDLCSAAEPPPFDLAAFTVQRSASMPPLASTPLSTLGEALWSPEAYSESFFRPGEPSSTFLLSQRQQSESFATAQRHSMFSTPYGASQQLSASYSAAQPLSSHQLYSSADIRQPHCMYDDGEDDDDGCSSNDAMSEMERDVSSQTAVDELNLLRPSLYGRDDHGEMLSNEMDDLSLRYVESQSTTADELDLLHENADEHSVQSVFGYPAHLALRWAEDCGASNCTTSSDPLDCL